MIKVSSVNYLYKEKKRRQQEPSYNKLSLKNSNEKAKISANKNEGIIRKRKKLL